MGVSIVANNCSGVRMIQDLKIEYNTPLIALQIMPEEFLKFCKNFKWYMEQEITEYKDFSDEHKKYFARMYGGGIDFVCGLCGDVAVVFQHYDSWEEAKTKWNRRKERIDYDNIVFFFVLDYDKYKPEAQTFADAHLDNAYIFTNNFDIDGEHFKYTIPLNPIIPSKELCFLDKTRPNHYVFEGGFKREWLKLT